MASSGLIHRMLPPATPPATPAIPSPTKRVLVAPQSPMSASTPSVPHRPTPLRHVVRLPPGGVGLDQLSAVSPALGGGGHGTVQSMVLPGWQLVPLPRMAPTAPSRTTAPVFPGPAPSHTAVFVAPNRPNAPLAPAITTTLSRQPSQIRPLFEDAPALLHLTTFCGANILNDVPGLLLATLCVLPKRQVACQTALQHTSVASGIAAPMEMHGMAKPLAATVNSRQVRRCVRAVARSICQPTLLLHSPSRRCFRLGFLPLHFFGKRLQAVTISRLPSLLSTAPPYHGITCYRDLPRGPEKGCSRQPPCQRPASGASPPRTRTLSA